MGKTNKRPRISRFDLSLSTRKNELCRVKCNSCDKAWVVCISCQRRFTATEIYLARKHLEEVHSGNNKTSSGTSVTSTVDFSSEGITTWHDSNSIIEQYLNESSVELNSRQFFSMKAISLSRAIQINAFAQSSTSSTLPTLHESTFYLILANILNQLPTTMHLELIDLLNTSKNLEMTSTWLHMIPNNSLKFIQNTNIPFTKNYQLNHAM